MHAFFWHGFSFDLLSICHVLLGTWDRVIYCKTNRLTNIPEQQINYMIKMFAKDKTAKPIYPINKDDYNMRFSYQSEVLNDKNFPLLELSSGAISK